MVIMTKVMIINGSDDDNDNNDDNSNDINVALNLKSGIFL